MPQGADLLAISIGTVHNPRHVPVSLQLALADVDYTAAPISIGVVSLYPSDKPGRFLIRVPRAAVQHCMPQVLIVTLVDQSGHSPDPSLVLSDIYAEWLVEP